MEENDNKIRPGDLVVVVKPCQYCGNVSSLGHIFTAGKIFTVGNKWSTDCCFVDNKEVEVAEVDDIKDKIIGMPLSYLKKISPLEEKDKIIWEEELHV